MDSILMKKYCFRCERHANGTCGEKPVDNCLGFEMNPRIRCGHCDHWQNYKWDESVPESEEDIGYCLFKGEDVGDFEVRYCNEFDPNYIP